jgi:parallel beta-helix repeat protein
MRAILLAAVLGLAVGLFSLGSSSGMWTGYQLPCTVIVQPGESIQAAIDAAKEGAVVCLAEGTWEENLVIGKGLTLRGLGPEKSVIKGVKEDEPVILISSNTEIEVIVGGLTIAEAKGWCAEEPLRCPNGLSLGGKVKATISGNTISRNNGGDGIYMWGSARATISGNNISENWGDGIYMVESAQATIEKNTISGNGGGIYMGKSAQATIEKNTISENKGDGIYMWGSARATISGNNISGNNGGYGKGYGIYMLDSAQANITGNTISRSNYGIYIEDSAQVITTGNTISENGWVGIYMEESAQATISGNTISGNWIGIYMLDSAQAKVENNTIQENRGCGIYASSQAKVSGTSNHLEANGADLCGNLPASLRIPLVPETGEAEIEFPGKYETLQHAIDALAPGGTIIIAPGEHQGGLTIWKPLTLKGPGGERGTLKGRTGVAPVISIISEVKDVKVERLTITGGYDGFLVYGQAIIEGNTISGNWDDGIYMLGSAQATISGNNIWGNRYGATWDNYDGIYMGESAQATIEKNTISGNRYGICMEDSAQATIEGNKITGNDCYGVALYQRPCYNTNFIFRGKVRGRVNEISGNMVNAYSCNIKEGEVCPAMLAFLMTEAGGYYGPRVVINEIELNPPCDDWTSSCLEWVELYNPSAAEVSLDGWILKTTQGETVSIPVAAYCKSISPGDYCIIARARWLDNENESLILFDATGNEIDRTPIVSDKDNDNNSWQRCPNGQDTDSDADWLFRPSTAGEENNC